MNANGTDGSAAAYVTVMKADTTKNFISGATRLP